MPAKAALLVLAAVAARLPFPRPKPASATSTSHRRGCNPTIPKPPNLGPHMIDTRIKLHCHYSRERNELGVWRAAARIAT